MANNIAPIENKKHNPSQFIVKNIPHIPIIIAAHIIIVAKSVRISDIKCKIVLIISIILQKIK